LYAPLLAEKNLPLLNLAARNELLAQLLAADNFSKDPLLSHLRPVSLERNQVLYEQGDTIDFIYFPLDCVVSNLAIMEDGTTIETSLVGCEGLVGISAILGSGKARQWLWVSISGTALQLEARFLNPLFLHNEDALKALLRFYRSTITQVSQRCVCNTRHTVLERLCCWLLMIHDRGGDSNLHLTQEMIASRLGSRRAGITVAAGVLQAMHAIEYRRGQIHIINRAVLEHAVCECYTIMRRELKLPPPQGSGLSLIYRCK
jgi:CRP-like cAMP-binding protein